MVALKRRHRPDVIKLTQQQKISGLPVVNAAGRVVGIVTNRDLRFETQLDQPVRNIMTPREKLVTVAEGDPLEKAQALMHKHRLERVLVVNGNFDLRGLITVKDILKSSQHPHTSKDGLGRLRVGAAFTAQLQDPVAQATEEHPVVGDEHHRALELAQGPDQHLLGREIEMIGRLVEHQEVRRI